MIAPDWSGRSNTFCEKAKKLAEQGYVAFTLDLYGEAKTGQTIEEKTSFVISHNDS